MVKVNCRPCGKKHLFEEGMRHCAYCGTAFEETELFNVGQRLKQEFYTGSRWFFGPLLGGFFVWVGLILAVKYIIPNQMLSYDTKGLLVGITMLVWLFVMFTSPFISARAVKFYPEKPSA